VAVDDTANTAFQTPVAIGVTANDSDPDGNLSPGTVQVTSPPSHGSVSCSANGVCTYIPNTGFSGTDTFEYRVCDADGACDTARVTITVGAAPPSTPAPGPAPTPSPTPPPSEEPDPGRSALSPDAVDDDTRAQPGTPIEIDVISNDGPDASDLALIVHTKPRHGTVECDPTGVCIYTPDPGFTGTDTFEYTVCDSNDRCDTATVTIRVRGTQLAQPGSNEETAVEIVPEETATLLPFTGRSVGTLVVIFGFLLMAGAAVMGLARLAGTPSSAVAPTRARTVHVRFESTPDGDTLLPYTSARRSGRAS
jgi:hypothetical protein